MSVVRPTWLGITIDFCLDYALEGNYWNHVELFPMHNGSYPRGAVDELIGILSHARAGGPIVEK